MNKILAILCLTILAAQGAPELSLSVTPEKLNLTPQEMQGAELVFSPGDTLRYIITAMNVGDGLMTEPVIVDPLPDGVHYVADSATDDNASVTFSIDDGANFQAWPPLKLDKDEEGNIIEIPAAADEVTHIRWEIHLELEPGDLQEYEFKAIIR